MKSWLSDDRIVAMYREAKDKEAQIEIICELTLLSDREVKTILYKAGYAECKPIVDEKRSRKILLQQWTETDIKRLKYLTAISTRWKDVAAHFPGRTAANVASYARHHGLELGQENEFKGSTWRRLWSEEKRQAAFELARNGATWKEIAAAFEVSEVTMRSMFAAYRKKGEDVPQVVDRRRKENK